MSAWLLVFNVLGWPVVHILVSKWATGRSVEGFKPNSFLFRKRNWEQDGLLYSRYFRVRRWKAKLPDGASWFAGGFSKKRIASRQRDYLERFILETCRGEWAHWMTLAALPLFWIPNPPWACGIMTIYAFLANVPCIVVQRYNRMTLQDMLSHRFA